MKANTNIIKKLARLGVLQVEPIKYKKENDIIIKNDEGVEQRVIIDNMTDEDLSLMIATEQLNVLKDIKFFIKTTFVLGLIAAGIWILAFLLSLDLYI